MAGVRSCHGVRLINPPKPASPLTAPPSATWTRIPQSCSSSSRPSAPRKPNSFSSLPQARPSPPWPPQTQPCPLAAPRTSRLRPRVLSLASGFPQAPRRVSHQSEAFRASRVTRHRTLWVPSDTRSAAATSEGSGAWDGPGASASCNT